MRIAWFSPLPPARSGIATYSADLVPRLAPAHAIDCFSARPTSATSSGRRGAIPTILSCISSATRRATTSCGATSPHFPRPRRAARRAAAPGARAGLLQQERFDDYRREFWYDHPEARRDFVEYAVAGLGGPIYYCWPMLRVVMRTARLVAVHNPRVAADLRDVSRHRDRRDPPGHGAARRRRRGARPRARGARRAARRGAVRRVRQDHRGETDRRHPARVRRGRARARRRPPAAGRRRLGLSGAGAGDRVVRARAARARPPATCRTRRSAATSRRPTRASACGGRRRSNRRRRGCSASRPGAADGDQRSRAPGRHPDDRSARPARVARAGGAGRHPRRSAGRGRVAAAGDARARRRSGGCARRWGARGTPTGRRTTRST